MEATLGVIVVVAVCGVATLYLVPPDLAPLPTFLVLEATTLLAAAVFVVVYRIRLHARATEEEARLRRAERAAARGEPFELREEEQPFEHEAQPVDPRPIKIPPSILGLIGGTGLGLLLLIPLWGTWIGTAQLVGHAIIGFVAGRRLAH